MVLKVCQLKSSLKSNNFFLKTIKHFVSNTKTLISVFLQMSSCSSKVRSEVPYSEQYIAEASGKGKLYTHIDENIPCIFLLALPLKKVKTSLNIPALSTLLHFEFDFMYYSS